MAALIIAIFPQNSSRGNREEQQDRTDPNSRFELARKPAWLLAFRQFGLPKWKHDFECDLFDLLSNAPYEIVRHRFRASFGRMRDFGARTAIFRRGARPRKARRKGICRGQTGQWVTPFRVLHHRPLGQLSIFIFSGTGLQDPRTNARFRCKNSDFQAGYKTPQSPPQRDLPRTNRPVGHALASAPSSTA